MASSQQALHNHTGWQEEDDQHDKSVLQKFIPKRLANKKQSSLTSNDGDKLSRSPSTDLRQTSRTSLTTGDSLVVLPHMYNTNSYERFAHGSRNSNDLAVEDLNGSGPIINYINHTTPRRATIDSPRAPAPLSYIISEASTSSISSTPRRRSMPEVSPLLIVSEAPSGQHPPAVPSYAFAIASSTPRRRRSTPTPIYEVEQLELEGSSDGGNLLSAPKRITRSKSLLDALKGIFKPSDKNDAPKSPPKSPSSKKPPTLPSMVKPSSSSSVSSTTSSPKQSGSPPAPHSPTQPPVLTPLSASALHRRTPPQLHLPPLTPQSRTPSNFPRSLSRSRSNPQLSEDTGEVAIREHKMETPKVLDAETIRNRRKSDTSIQQQSIYGNAGGTDKSNLASVDENPPLYFPSQPTVTSTLLAPPTRGNFGAALSWREVATDGTKVWKNQSMAKTSTNVVAVERVSSVVKSEPGQEPSEQIERPLSLDLFELVQQIGSGGYGQVYLSRKTDTGEIVALKVMDKTNISRKNKVLNIRNERNALAHLTDQSWIVQLLYAFQDEQKVYLAMEYLAGGDLRGVLRSIGSIEEDDMRTWGAEMILAVNEVHQLGYIHRDLKPENFLVDKNGHLKIADLGISTSGASAFVDLKIKVKAIHRGSVISSELVLNDGKTKLKRNQSIVGSPAYMAPEMLERSGYGPEVDSWSLGCMFYEMLTSKNLFEGLTPQAAFANVLRWREILQELESTAESQMSKCAWDLIKKFLCEPKDRLLRNGLTSVMAHPFFDGVDWSRLRTRVPPFIPKLRDEVDTSYFPATRDEAFGEILNVDTSDYEDLETSASFAGVPHLPLPSSPESPRESPFPTASIHRVYSNGNYQQETSRMHDSHPLSHAQHHHHMSPLREESNHTVSSHPLLEDDGPASDDLPHTHTHPHSHSRSHPPSDEDISHHLPSTPSSPFNMKKTIPSTGSLYTLHDYNALAHPSLSTMGSTYTVNTYNSVQSVLSMASGIYSVPSSLSMTSETTLTTSLSISPSNPPSSSFPAHPLATMTSFTFTPSPATETSPPDYPSSLHNRTNNSPRTLSPAASPRRVSPLRPNSPSPRRSSPPRSSSPLRSTSPLRSNSPSPRDSRSPSPRPSLQPSSTSSPRQTSPRSPKASAIPAPPTILHPLPPPPLPPLPPVPAIPHIPPISNIPTNSDSARSLYTPVSSTTPSSSFPPSDAMRGLRSPQARRANHATNEINLHHMYSNARTSSSTDPTTTPTSSIITPPPIRKQKNSSLSSIEPPRSTPTTTNSLPNVHAPFLSLSSSLASSATTTSLPPSRLSTPIHDHPSSLASSLSSHPSSHPSSLSSHSSSSPSYSLGALLTHKAHGTHTSISTGQARKIQISGFDFVRSGGQ